MGKMGCYVLIINSTLQYADQWTWRDIKILTVGIQWSCDKTAFGQARAQIKTEKINEETKNKCTLRGKEISR